MAYQPIKFTRKQYQQLRKLVKQEFGNVSMTKGIFLISYIYSKYTPKRTKEHFRKKYYTPFTDKKQRFKQRKC